MFVTRSLATNRERLNELKGAEEAGGGRAGIDAIFRALVGPTLRGCLGPSSEGSTAARFMIRASIESVPPIRRIKNREVDHLRKFAAAMRRSRPTARVVSIGDCTLRWHGAPHQMDASSDNCRTEMRLNYVRSPRRGCVFGDALTGKSLGKALRNCASDAPEKQIIFGIPPKHTDMAARSTPYLRATKQSSFTGQAGLLVQRSSNDLGIRFISKSKHPLPISAHSPSLLKFPALENAGEKTGCALHPRSRVQCAQRSAHTSIQVQRRASGLPCAMALRLMP